MIEANQTVETSKPTPEEVYAGNGNSP